MSRTPLQTNAADPQQVKHGRRVERDRERQRVGALVAVMATFEGRATMWDLLERAGVYRSVFALEPTLMAFNAGRQDFGHELQALLLQASPEGYDLMTTEARIRAERADVTNEAVHTPAAGAGRAATGE